MSDALTVDFADLAANALCGTLLLIGAEPGSLARVRRLQASHADLLLLQADGGIEGVRLAQAEQPDLVLLDMRLPDISGLDVMRRLNSEIDRRGLRVSILTTEPGSMETVRAMSLGAFEYWVKPLVPAVFEAGLRRALSGQRADPAHTLQRSR